MILRTIYSKVTSILIFLIIYDTIKADAFKKKRDAFQARLFGRHLLYFMALWT